jgi:hypothetical protein
VLVADELEPLERELQDALGLAEPFHDPGVAMFGLQNAVFALGDCFIEVVSPVEPDTAASRYLQRHGDGGYMVMFDLEDLDGARSRAAQQGVRVVWQIDLPDISGTHLHPADMAGAIVSIDCSRPYGTWRWGGPQWTEQTGTGARGRLAGVTIAVREPTEVAARWANVLGVEPAQEDAAHVRLDGGELRFIAAPDERSQGLVEVVLDEVPSLAGSATVAEVGGVQWRALANA